MEVLKSNPESARAVSRAACTKAWIQERPSALQTGRSSVVWMAESGEGTAGAKTGEED